MSRLVFIAIAASIVLRLFLVQGLKPAAAGAVIVLLIGTMVWFSDFWAEYIIYFGFWESKASDYRHPQRSAGAVAFLGWVSLLLFGAAVCRL